jgi:membrane protease YdiL (CAAX protease family)
MSRRNRLGFEYFACFIALPAAMFIGIDSLRSLGFRPPLIPMLWIWAVICWTVLRFDRSFDHRAMWRLPRPSPIMAVIVLRWIALAAVMAIYIHLRHPEHLLELPRERPRLWVIILFAYPLFSVLPQSIVWRSFVLHRYRPVFGRDVVMLGAATVAFAFIHLVFKNFEAVVLTAIGGLVFTWTHMRSGSMLLAAFEHALYGCWAFTIGYGRFLYGGSVPPG